MLFPARAAVSPADRVLNFSFLDAQRQEVQAQDGRKMSIWCGSGGREDASAGARSILQNSMAAEFLGGGTAPAPTYIDTWGVARVAEAYLYHWEAARRKESLRHAREAISFLRYLQDDRGLFTRAFLNGGKLELEPVNQAGILDVSSARAFRALCSGFRIFNRQDSSLSRQIYESIRKVFPYIRKSLEDPASGFGKYMEVQGRNMPAWLVGNSTVTSGELLLGLCELERTAHSDEVSEMSRKLAQGILESQLGTPDEFPFLAFSQDLAARGRWLTADDCQVAALAEAGAVLGEKKYLQAAQRSASGILSMLASGYGPFHGFTPFPELEYQTSSAACACVENLSALYRATGLEYNSILAGLFASWFLGNNPARAPVYSRDTGMGREALRNGAISGNADSKATAEALISLMCLRGTPGEEYLSSVDESVQSMMVLEAEKGQPVRKAFEVNLHQVPAAGGEERKLVVVDRQTSFWLRFSIPETENYILFLIYLKQPFFDSSTAVNLRIDGNKQFTVPMGGSSDAAFLTLQKVADPSLLYRGLHTLGVKYSGLTFSNPAEIDSVILQPVLSRRVFRAGGRRVMLCKSMGGTDVSYRIPSSLLEGRRIRVARYSSSGNAEAAENLPPVLQPDGGVEITVRPYGSTIVEW
jgi:hypothetical protein